MENHNKKFSVTKANFRFDHKRRSSNYHSEKPRLDDILAEYRKMDKTSRLHETKSASFNTKKKANPLDMLKTNGGFLSKVYLEKRKDNQVFF